jgi:hypothetical protein
MSVSGNPTVILKANAAISARTLGASVGLSGLLEVNFVRTNTAYGPIDLTSGAVQAFAQSGIGKAYAIVHPLNA